MQKYHLHGKPNKKTKKRHTNYGLGVAHVLQGNKNMKNNLLLYVVEEENSCPWSFFTSGCWMGKNYGS